MIDLDEVSESVITGWCEDISKNKQWESVYSPKEKTKSVEHVHIDEIYPNGKPKKNKVAK